MVLVAGDAAAAGAPAAADATAATGAAGAREAGPVTDRGRRTRARLVAAARGVFEARGFDATRMSDVAEAAGVSHGTVYVYFESKSALLAAVVQELLAEIGEYLRAVPTEADDVSRIAEANLRYLRVYGQHARLLQVVEQVATADPAFAAVLAAFRARHVARIAEAIRRLQLAGRAADLDADVAAAALSAMVEGYARHSPGYDVAAANPTLTLLWLRALGLDAGSDLVAASPEGTRTAAGPPPSSPHHLPPSEPPCKEQ